MNAEQTCVGRSMALDTDVVPSLVGQPQSLGVTFEFGQ
jgi:hypothetical protein